jgi:hypothetical protein
MISDSVVIMTADEFHERLVLEFRRGVESTFADDKLYKRAALVNNDTGVTYSTDGVGRILVTNAICSGLGDCLTIGYLRENDGSVLGHWYLAHFSPARARIIANDLIRRATLLEKENGVNPIDPIPEKMRKGPIGI